MPKQKITANAINRLPPQPKKPNSPNRLLISTPTVGSVRMEWVQGRFGQVIPCNFSMADVQNFMNSNAPIGYQIADAENLAVKMAVEGKYDWFLSWEDDNIPPLNALIKINQYMIRGDVPIVSGLYFTRSEPPEPIMYRGRGTGHYADWKLGDKVWVDGIPLGFTLFNGRILEALWDESPEYVVNGAVTRRVFNVPSDGHFDKELGGWMNTSGTSDLDLCQRIMDNGIFTKAGFPEYEGKKNPFLVDTSIFLKHIDRASGIQYPMSLPRDFAEGKITWQEATKLMM